MSRRAHRPRRSPPRPLPWLLALACTGAAQPLMAAGPQTSPDLPDEQVVGTTPIDGIGVPVSRYPGNAQHIGSGAVTQRGASNVADALDAQLGSVTVSNGTGNPYQNDVNYRGLQATSLLGAPVGLSVYLDGVRMNEPFGSVVNWDLIPMNAVAGIDVLPGSNPMFGLNTLGGALSVGTKNGRDHAGSSISLTGGSFGRRALGFTHGWFDAARDTDYFVAGNLDRQNGYRHHSSSSIGQLFGKARWRGQGGRSELSLMAAYSDNRLNGTQSLPEDMLSDPKSAYTWPDTLKNRMALVSLRGSHWFDDLRQIGGGVYYRSVRSSYVNSNAELDDGCFADDGSVAVAAGGAYKCGNMAPGGTAVNAVTSPTALARGYGRWTSSINSSLVESSARTSTVGTTLQWTSLAKLGARSNRLTAGVTFEHSYIRYDQSTVLGRLIDYQVVAIPNQAYGFTANGAAPSATNPLSFSGSPVLGSVGLGSTTNSMALYLGDTLDVTRRFSVTAAGSFNFTSLRQGGTNLQFMNDDGGYSWTDDDGVTHYNPAYLGSYRYANNAAGFNAAPSGIPAGGVAGPVASDLSGSHQYRRFNPALGFSYRFDHGPTVFGGYSESMRAPTTLELSCADPQRPCALPTGFNGDPDLKAVVARTFELGARGQIGASTRWNAAMYQTRLSNDIQFISTSNSLGYFSNVGTTQRRGFELGTQTVLDRWSVGLSYGYVQATYRSAFTTAAGQDVTSGNRIPGIPGHSLKARATYAVTPRILAGASLLLVGRQYAHGNESNAAADGIVAGYSVVNLDAHYQVRPDLRLSAWVNNLFDTRYSTYGLSGITSIYSLQNQQFRTPASSRSVWIGLTYSPGAGRRS